jgi:hypothetical protein
VKLKAFILTLGASSILSWADEPRPKSFAVPYYARKLDAPAHGVLCLTVGVAQNALLFGHSALSFFPLDESEQKKRDPISHSVKSAGFWPLSSVDGGGKEGSKFDLVYDHPNDSFLTFEHDPHYAENARHCVQVTKAETDKLDTFLEKFRDRAWMLHYNCNDLSSDAFAEITGIEFQSRSPSTLYCSTPKTLMRNVRKSQLDASPAGTLSYQAISPAEIKKLQLLEDRKKIGFSLFKTPSSNAKPLRETPALKKHER